MCSVFQRNQQWLHSLLLQPPSEQWSLHKLLFLQPIPGLFQFLRELQFKLLDLLFEWQLCLHDLLFRFLSFRIQLHSLFFARPIWRPLVKLQQLPFRMRHLRLGVFLCNLPVLQNQLLLIRSLLHRPLSEWPVQQQHWKCLQQLFISMHPLLKCHELPGLQLKHLLKCKLMRCELPCWLLWISLRLRLMPNWLQHLHFQLSLPVLHCRIHAFR